MRCHELRQKGDASQRRERGHGHPPVHTFLADEKGRTMPDIYFASGIRTPFSKVDGALAGYDAIALSVPVVQAMAARLKPATKADFAVWGSVVPSLGWSNIAREIWLDAHLDPTVPAYSVVLACASSVTAAIAAGGMLQEGARELAMVGGVESLSRVQIGLNQRLSDWLRHFLQARSLGAKLETFSELRWHDIRLHIPAIVNRTTGKSMGEHTEETAKEWHISRESQDEWALKGHQRVIAARASGFFDDLIVAVGAADHDTIPRDDTSMEKLARLPPAFDRISGRGTLTAGNSSPRKVKKLKLPKRRSIILGQYGGAGGGPLHFG